MAKKLKNKNNYTYINIGKLDWKANITNDESATEPTLSFKSDFVTAANELVSKMNTVNKNLKNISEDLKKIKKQGGDTLTTNSIENTRKAFVNASTAFTKSCKKLRNGAVNGYNEWLQALYDAMRQSALTDQGTETNAQVNETEETTFE